MQSDVVGEDGDDVWFPRTGWTAQTVRNRCALVAGWIKRVVLRVIVGPPRLRSAMTGIGARGRVRTLRTGLTMCQIAFCRPLRVDVYERRLDSSKRTKCLHTKSTFPSVCVGLYRKLVVQTIAVTYLPCYLGGNDRARNRGDDNKFGRGVHSPKSFPQ